MINITLEEVNCLVLQVMGKNRFKNAIFSTITLHNIKIDCVILSKP